MRQQIGPVISIELAGDKVGGGGRLRDIYGRQQRAGLGWILTVQDQSVRVAPSVAEDDVLTAVTVEIAYVGAVGQQTGGNLLRRKKLARVARVCEQQPGALAV